MSSKARLFLNKYFNQSIHRPISGERRGEGKLTLLQDSTRHLAEQIGHDTRDSRRVLHCSKILKLKGQTFDSPEMMDAFSCVSLREKSVLLHTQIKFHPDRPVNG